MSNLNTHAEPKFIHDKQVIVNILREIGVPRSVLGFTYIQDIIVSVTDGGKRNRFELQNLYYNVSQMYNVTPASIERAIRYAIGVSWKYNSSVIIQDLYRYCTDGRPAHNKEFITAVADEYLSRMTNK